MKNNTNDYKTGWDKRQEERKLQKKISKILFTRASYINITSIITDDNGASLVKFTWIRNCNDYLAVVSELGSIQLYREV